MIHHAHGSWQPQDPAAGVSLASGVRACLNISCQNTVQRIRSRCAPASRQHVCCQGPRFLWWNATLCKEILEPPQSHEAS